MHQLPPHCAPEEEAHRSADLSLALRRQLRPLEPLLDRVCLGDYRESMACPTSADPVVDLQDRLFLLLDLRSGSFFFSHVPVDKPAEMD